MIIEPPLPTTWRRTCGPAKGGRISIGGGGSGTEAAVPFGAAAGVDAGLLFMSSGNAGRAGTAQSCGSCGDGRGRELRAVVGAVLPLARHGGRTNCSTASFGKIMLSPLAWPTEARRKGR